MLKMELYFIWFYFKYMELYFFNLGGLVNFMEISGWGNDRSLKIEIY